PRLRAGHPDPRAHPHQRVARRRLPRPHRRVRRIPHSRRPPGRRAARGGTRMTAIQARATHIPATTSRPTFVRQLRSELIKLMTVRGTWWSVGIVALLTIGIAFIVTSAMSPPIDNIIMAVIMPVQFTMMLAGILGVISVTGEYSTGMVRSTFTA